MTSRLSHLAAVKPKAQRRLAEPPLGRFAPAFHEGLHVLGIARGGEAAFGNREPGMCPVGPDVTDRADD